MVTDGNLSQDVAERGCVNTHRGANLSERAESPESQPLWERTMALVERVSATEPSGRAAWARAAVLVVDDEPDTRDVLACTLEDAGATTTTAANVQDALDLLARQQVDVLLSDIGMPEEDGYSLIAKLGSEGAANRPRTVIAVTAFADGRDRRRVLAAGFDHHVAKPVDFDALVRIIGDSVKGLRAQ